MAEPRKIQVRKEVTPGQLLHEMLVDKGITLTIGGPMDTTSTVSASDLEGVAESFYQKVRASEREAENKQR